jgi:secreted trypsin-like serine protease
MTIVARVLALVGVPFFLCAPVHALTGADLADLTVQRYTVSIHNGKSRCTGVVLAQNIVLTAAHCVGGNDLLWIAGDPGWGSLTTPPVILSHVSEVIQHPRYDSHLSGSPDLAILKLGRPLPDRFTPVFLDPRLPGNGDDLIAAGYGMGSDKDPKAGTILRMVLQRVSMRYSTYLTLTSVSAADSAGAAPGDSGGPVFTYRGMYALVAIMVGHSSRYTMAVTIASNYEWIKDTIAKLGGS